jgi:hypothetical protein
MAGKHANVSSYGSRKQKANLRVTNILVCRTAGEYEKC